jgi:hypothetical protein
MADGEGGGSKVLRGIMIALGLVIAIVLLAVFFRQFRDFLVSVWNYIADHFPNDTGQQVAVIVYLILAALAAIAFSNAGHFTAYGIATGLGSLLWFLFWEGFPPIGLKPSWAHQLGLGHMGPNEVILWGVVGAAVITLVFVPLELREKLLRRRHQLGEE